MMQFSHDPDLAEQQMHAVIFYLTTFGYIDGDFDVTEKKFVREYITKLVTARASGAMPGADVTVLREVVRKYTTHFHEVFEGIDEEVRELFSEAVAEGEDQWSFVRTKLKLRCFEIFKGFEEAGQEALLQTIDELILADGVAHPAELAFRGELADLLNADLGVELEEVASAPIPVRVTPVRAPMPSGDNHAFFAPTERHYSRDPAKLSKQSDADMELLDRAERLFDEQRARGEGRLTGKANVGDIEEGAAFLDGFTYVLKPRRGARYDITVLGDLHGCYSVLKAALMESHFFDKVDAFRADPVTHPEPRLVLLGDYIDRGRFSLNGVLRTVLQLFVTAPEFVYVLRGNHEYYVEYKGDIYGGVKPAEAINTLKPHLPVAVFRRYARFFDRMPTSLLLDRTFFVHGGVPRDRTFRERFRDLASLNDPDIRFQMMWSDPSSVDVVPAELQEKTARFAFGRSQARAFLQRIGCHTLVRGHEKINRGFAVTYDEPAMKLMTLFSSGGVNNEDLPKGSSYRGVTPMALSLRLERGEATWTPWAPSYGLYNDPARNAFFQVPPEIEHRLD